MVGKIHQVWIFEKRLLAAWCMLPALYLDRGGENAIYLHIGLQKRAMHKKKSRNLEPAKRIRKGTTMLLKMCRSNHSLNNESTELHTYAELCRQKAATPRRTVMYARTQIQKSGFRSKIPCTRYVHTYEHT